MQDLGEKLLSLGAKRFVDKGGEPQEIVKLSGRESRRKKFTYGLKRRTSIRSQPIQSGIVCLDVVQHLGPQLTM